MLVVCLLALALGAGAPGALGQGQGKVDLLPSAHPHDSFCLVCLWYFSLPIQAPLNSFVCSGFVTCHFPSNAPEFVFCLLVLLRVTFNSSTPDFVCVQVGFLMRVNSYSSTPEFDCLLV